MLTEDFEDKKVERDNIDLCVSKAEELSAQKGRKITYGKYMGLYHKERYPFDKRKKSFKDFPAKK